MTFRRWATFFAKLFTIFPLGGTLSKNKLEFFNFLVVKTLENFYFYWPGPIAFYSSSLLEPLIRPWLSVDSYKVPNPKQLSHKPSGVYPLFVFFIPRGLYLTRCNKTLTQFMIESKISSIFINVNKQGYNSSSRLCRKRFIVDA